MLNEIVSNRIYQEDKLNKLFSRYLKRNAPEHRPTLQCVVDDLRKELRMR